MTDGTESPLVLYDDSLDKIFEVFNKVKGRFTVPEGHLELIPEQRYDEVIEFIDNHFLKDEPLCAALGVEIKPYTGRLLWRLKQNISIMAVSDKSDEIMGVFLCDVEKKGCKIDLNTISDENVREYLTFETQKDPTVDLFVACGAEEVFHLGNVAVKKDYRRQGLGSILFSAAVKFAKELGFKGVSGEGDSNFSQKIFEKLGFETILELSYSDYKYKEGYLSEQTGEHTGMKIYFLLL